MILTRIVRFTVLLAVIPATASAAPLLRYTFDELSGSALDTGTAPLTDATLEGGATRSADTPGGFGSSLDLRNDSPVAHALEGDAADLDGLSALTLTTWLKVDIYPKLGASGNDRLMAKQGGGANFDGFSWNMNATPNDGPVGPDNFRLGLFLGGSGGFVGAFSSDDATAVEWAFLATTYDSTSGTVAFYMGSVNSPVVLLGTPQVLGLNPGVIDGLSARFGVGFTDAAPASDLSAIGLQDDVRVYGQALSVTELEGVRQSNVPEPNTISLLGLGSVVALGTRRKHRLSDYLFNRWGQR
jgi:hypothetical protein